jgi:hypothetical protein
MVAVAARRGEGECDNGVGYVGFVYELCARGSDGDQDGGTGRMLLKPWSVDRLSEFCRLIASLARSNDEVLDGPASSRLRSAGGAIQVVNLVSESRRRFL